MRSAASNRSAAPGGGPATSSRRDAGPHRTIIAAMSSQPCHRSHVIGACPAGRGPRRFPWTSSAITSATGLISLIRPTICPAGIGTTSGCPDRIRPLVRLADQQVLQWHAEWLGGAFPARCRVRPLVLEQPGGLAAVDLGPDGIRGRGREQRLLDRGRRGELLVLTRDQPGRAHPGPHRAERERRRDRRPSRIPPVASTGTPAPTASTISGTRTMVAISPVCPPAS